MYALVAVPVGLIIGLALHGRLSGLALDRLRLWPLLPVAVVLAVAQLPAGGSLSLALGVGAAGSVLVVAAANVGRLPSLALVGAGTVLNFVPITADGGMPVSVPALAAARGWTRARAAAVHLSGYHHLQRPGDRVMGLADVLPVAALRTVMSAGDVVVAVGVAAVIVEMMLRPAAPRPREQPGTDGPRPGSRQSRHHRV